MLGVSHVPRAAAFWMEALGYVPRKDMEDDWVVAGADGRGRSAAGTLRPGTHLVRVADDSPARIVPKPPGAADTLLEAGAEPTDLSPTPLAGTAGAASILIRTERRRLSGQSCRPAPRVTPGGRPEAGGARKKRKLMFYDVGHSTPLTNRHT